MEFNNQPADPSKQVDKEPLIKPNPYSTRGIRLKLFMLVCLLGLVFVAMHEAGKPENWEWMGFDNDADIRLDGDDSTTSGDSRFDRDKLPTNDPDESTRSRNANRSPDRRSTPSIRIVSETSSQSKSFQTGDAELDYPVAAVRFWEETYPALPAPQKKVLMQTTRQLRTGQLVQDRSLEESTKLIKILEVRREQFHQYLFDQLTLTPDKSPSKPLLSEQYYASEQVWEKMIKPALEAVNLEKDITVAQQQAIFKLQPVLDQLAYRQVQDKTTIGWVGDSEAWIRSWERLLKPKDADLESKPVKRIQLMSQPDVFRGRMVSLGGWIRSGRKIELSDDSATGLSHCYELWLRPADTSVGPYCVYCAELPKVDGLPVFNEKYQDANIKVTLDGLFFKLRKFVAGSQDIEYCPLLVSSTLTVIAEEDLRESSSNLAFSVYWLIPAIIGLPVFAVFVAWLAYRGSEVTRLEPSEKNKNRLGASLDDLRNDPNIETDLERIQKLEGTDEPTD
ncbi:MAG: hypothetical protein AAFN77_07155 [Planctomycetota bacterium]